MVMSTGSQGEPMSALTLLSANENRWLKVHPDDTVICSSHPIPGNEHAVTKVIDNLFRLGAEVIHSGLSTCTPPGTPIEELKLYQSIAKPEWFVPVHGEYHHLVAHTRLAQLMGTPADHILLAEDGDRLVLDDEGSPRGPGALRVRLRARHRGRHRPRGAPLPAHPGRRRRRGGDRLRGPGQAEAGLGARDRQPRLDLRAGGGGADRGARPGRVRNSVEKALADGADVAGIERAARRASGGFVSDKTRRRPMIVPVVLEA